MGQASQVHELFVFEVNDADWVLAANAAEARKVWMEHTGDFVADEWSLIPEAELHPVSDERLQRLKYTDEDGYCSFAEQLERMRGTAEWKPQFFASSEY